MLKCGVMPKQGVVWCVRHIGKFARFVHEGWLREKPFRGKRKLQVVDGSWEASELERRVVRFVLLSPDEAV
jgi:hypothetical protein